MPREAPVTRAMREARGRLMVEATYGTICSENQTSGSVVLTVYVAMLRGVCRWQFAQDGLAAASLRGHRIAECPDLRPERQYRIFLTPECLETCAEAQGDDRRQNAIARYHRHPQRIGNGKRQRRQSVPETEGRRYHEIACDIPGENAVETGPRQARRSRRDSR